MSDIDLAVGGEEFRVGGVLSKSFSVFFRCFVTFAVIAVAVQTPPTVISLMFFSDILDAMSTGDVAAMESADLGFGGGSWGYWALQITGYLLQTLITAAIVTGTVITLRDENPGILECLKGGLSRLLPTFAVALLFVLMLAVLWGGGSVILIMTQHWIGGLIIFLGLFVDLYLFVIFYAAVPAVVAERPGIFGAFSRSLELTRGTRWRILGLVLVVLAIMIVASIVIWLPLGALVTVIGFRVMTLAGTLFGALLMVFLIVVMTVAYHDLRRAKEGVDSDEIAAVFE